MKCQNLACDRSEGVGFRMIQTEIGNLCSTCRDVYNIGVLNGIKLADKTIEAEWKKSKDKIGGFMDMRRVK